MKSSRLLTSIAFVALASLSVTEIVAQTTRPARQPQRPEISQPTTRPAAENLKHYAIDQVHSSLTFQIMHMNVAWFTGRFNEISGEIHFDESNPENSRIDVTVPVESIDTNHPGRDAHLKSDDFFDMENHPTLRFVSTEIHHHEGDNFTLKCHLTILGETREIEADLVYHRTTTHPRSGGEISGGTATFTINRSEWGMDYGIANGSLGDEVRITISIEGILQEG